MPTLLELAGLEVEGQLDAESLVPLLAPKPVAAPHRIAITESSLPAIASRVPAWKYILQFKQRQREQLFDLLADPGEQRDIAGEQPDVLARHRIHVLDYLMLHRPGPKLVLVGDQEPEMLDLRIHGIASFRSFFGLRARRAKDGSTQVKGETGGALALVAAVETTDAVTVAGADLEVTDRGRYLAGDLERLLSDGRKGLFLFAGPPRIAEQRPDAPTLDAQQLRAMRGLGYVGDKK